MRKYSVRRAGVVAALSALLLTTSTSPIYAAPPINNGGLDGQIKIRQQYGFQADYTFVQSVLLDPSSTSTDAGIPLTPSESAEIQRRNLTGRLGFILGDKLSPTGIWGGSWIYNSNDGALAVALTVEPDPTVLGTRKSILGSNPFYVVRRNYEERTLIQVNRLLAYSALYDEMKIQTARFNPESINGIDVTLSNDSPHRCRESYYCGVRALLQVCPDYRPADTCSHAGFPRGSSFGGGWLSAGTSLKVCTDGYSNVRDSVGRCYTITAGHCFVNGRNVYQGTGSGNFIGQASSSTVREGAVTDCDCEVVGLIPSGTGTEKVYIDNNRLFTFSASGNAGINTTVCHAGATSFEARGGSNSCGIVTSTGSTTTIGFDNSSYKLTDGPVVQFTAPNQLTNGDSGGPVGQNHFLLGFVSWTGGSSGQGGYSKSQNVGSSNVHLGY